MFQVLLTSLKTGGVGLNLTAASNVFIMVLSIFVSIICMCWVKLILSSPLILKMLSSLSFRIHGGIQRLRSKQ